MSTIHNRENFESDQITENLKIGFRF